MGTGWVVVTYRVPAEPSRHRVALWRELRRVGAVSLQQATWALPAHALADAALERVAALVARADGELFVFAAEPLGDAGPARLEQLFLAAREEEWAEFIRECDKFDDEIAHEIAIAKFTSAELDEEEQNLDRLRRWFREIRARDPIGAPSAATAELRLKASTERLEGFTERVFEMGGRP
jgi:DNA-binding transcriptional regulator PaaX